jgi:hypothetical protein
MNKYILVLIGLVYCNSNAQLPFPLAKGNVWHYTIEHQFYQPPLQNSYRTINVIGDSIMPNGKQYWVLDQVDMLGGQYIRCDSVHIYYWQSGVEKQVINLSDSVGAIDTIRWSGFFTSRCTGKYQSTLFAKPANIFSYSLGGLLFGDLTFASGFGYSRYEYHADQPIETDVWKLTGCIISNTLYGTTDVEQAIQELPTQFALFQNYPNPFNPSTTISFSIPKKSFVSLKVYDVLGRFVTQLVSEDLSPGVHFRRWTPIGLASGIYYYRIQSGTFRATRKCLLLR